MYDPKDHLYAFDIDEQGEPGPDGKPQKTYEIESVSGGVLEGIAGGKPSKTKKPMVKLVGEAKKFAVNKTNGKTISQLYGKETNAWKGKLITLYSTTTNFGGETMACIRVRPERPDGGAVQRSSGGGNGRSKRDADREAATQAADDLLAKYQTATDADMAELKELRGKHWESWGPGIREAIGNAAKAARARIDAAIAALAAAAQGQTGAAGTDPAVTDDEAAEVRRREAEEAARGR